MLNRDIDLPCGRVTRGTIGTVLWVFGNGLAYQIEFGDPYDVPETVPGDAIDQLR